MVFESVNTIYQYVTIILWLLLILLTKISIKYPSNFIFITNETIAEGYQTKTISINVVFHCNTILTYNNQIISSWVQQAAYTYDRCCSHCCHSCRLSKRPKRGFVVIILSCPSYWWPPLCIYRPPWTGAKQNNRETESPGDFRWKDEKVLSGEILEKWWSYRMSLCGACLRIGCLKAEHHAFTILHIYLFVSIWLWLVSWLCHSLKFNSDGWRKGTLLCQLSIQGIRFLRPPSVELMMD